MNRNTSSPLYELRLSAIGAIESQAIPACAGIRPPTAPLAAGDSASMKRPGKMPATRQRTASENIAASDEAVGLVRALGRLRARAAKEGYAERLGEARGGERGREREQRPDRGRQYLKHPRRQDPGSAKWPETSAIRRRSR